jgi:hypothetical protein
MKMFLAYLILPSFIAPAPVFNYPAPLVRPEIVLPAMPFKDTDSERARIASTAASFAKKAAVAVKRVHAGRVIKNFVMKRFARRAARTTK